MANTISTLDQIWEEIKDLPIATRAERCLDTISHGLLHRDQRSCDRANFCVGVLKALLWRLE
jgi:hypothetical protein